jgi:purine-cytosine permease-like protein
VTPFAAGCAICGTDLEAYRAERAQRRQIAVPTPSVRLPYDWWLFVGTAVAALMFPILGLILAYFAGRDRIGGERTFFIAMGAIAVVLLVVPQLRFGVLNLVYG